MAVGGPFFQDGALVAVGALPHQAVHHHVLIHDALAAPAAVEAAVQNGVLTAAAVEGCTLLNNGDRRAFFGGGTGGADAGQAGAHNHHVKVQLFADRIDDGLFSQPVIAGVSGRFLGGRLDSDAHGLLDAAAERLPEFVPCGFIHSLQRLFAKHLGCIREVSPPNLYVDEEQVVLLFTDSQTSAGLQE